MPFGAFLPKEFSFFDFFDQHAAKCVASAKLLVECLAHIDNAEALAKQIKQLEQEGDDITHLTVETLHRTFITPIDRDQIHGLISGLDDVLDFINATAQRIMLYEIREVPAEAKELTEVVLKATEQVEKAILGLRRLKFPMELLKTCVEINRLENEADAVLRKGIARLFKEASNPIEVIKWKELYEFMEGSTDRCEDVANLIEGVVLEHA